jgi:molecular chaperone GrpE
MKNKPEKNQGGERKEAAPGPSPEAAPPAAQEESVRMTPAEHQSLLKKIEELEGNKDQFLRKAADYDNARKRLEREKEEYYKFAVERLIRELIPVLDNLNRAIEQAEKIHPQDSVLRGIHLIEKQVFDVLKKYGVTRLEALGKPFSPEQFEAIGEVETDQTPEGNVAEELEAGYLLHGRVLRPARVRVAKLPSASRPKPSEEKSDLG